MYNPLIVERRPPRPLRLQLQETERQIFAAREIRNSHNRQQLGAFLESPTKCVRQWARTHRISILQWQEKHLNLRLELAVGERLLLLDEFKSMAIGSTVKAGDGLSGILAPTSPRRTTAPSVDDC